MSFGKVAKLVFLALAFTVFLYLVGSHFVGPGISDFEDPIINGYEYSDAGHYEKTIIYTGVERPKQIVVDARVDGYRIEGDSLFVARRPREGFKVGEVMHSRLKAECEYWVIDTKTHQIGRASESHGLRCN